MAIEALWWAVIVSGFYHGVNPGMGWPLAVSAGLMERKTRALPKALGMMALGHFCAMLLILLPFSIITLLVEWETQIRTGAGVIVLAMGVYLLINRRHPKMLARVHPARLALWSFLAAMAHGAGLMLVPIYLGINAADIHAGHGAHQLDTTLITGNLLNAVWITAAHTAAMSFAGGLIAVIVYRTMGLKFISRTWFNLDLLWALSLIVVGLFGIYSAQMGMMHH